MHPVIKCKSRLVGVRLDKGRTCHGLDHPCTVHGHCTADPLGQLSKALWSPPTVEMSLVGH